MTSEEKVRRIYSDAALLGDPGSPICRIVERFGPTEERLELGMASGDPRRAWADAWRNIDARHKANVAKVTARYPGHRITRVDSESVRFRHEIVYGMGTDDWQYFLSPGHPFHVYALAARMIDEAANQPA